MADQISGLTGSLQGQVQGLVNSGQGFIDKIIPPETRSKIIAWITKFANEKPKLAAFLASHIALSGFPLGLFFVMTISIAIFAVIVALILALLASVLFIVFCVGVALVFLLPTLFITTGIATFIFLWGLGVYYILKYFNEKPIPGIHMPLKEGLQGEASDYADKGVSEGYGQNLLGSGAEPSESEKQGTQQREEAEKEVEGRKKPQKLDEQKQNGSAHKQNGSANKQDGGVTDQAKEAADVGKHAGKASSAAQDHGGKAAGAAQNATKGATGAVGGLTGGLT